MAKATTGTSFGLNSRQVAVAQSMAAGCSEDQILRMHWLITPESAPEDKRKAKRELRKMMELPGFADCYRSEVKRLYMPIYSKALAKISEQIDSTLPWLANKAANDILTRVPGIMEEDSNTIRVQIEGMPELGTPDE